MIKITLLLASFTLTLAANAFTHKFENVPKSYASCHEQAAELAQAFAAQTGNDTGAVACMKDDNRLSSYELTYTAEKQLAYATTDVFSINMASIYKTERECKELLSSNIRQFEISTGLSPFIAYCKRDSHSSSPRWLPLVFGFGEAKKLYWISSYSYFSIPYQFDSAAFVANLKIALEKEGADFAHAFSLPSLGYGSMEIHYYSKEKVPFDLMELPQVPKREQCLGNLERFNATLGKFAIEPVTSYCGQVSVGARWEVTALFSGNMPLSTRPSAEGYKSFELCEADRSRLTEFYKSNVDKKILDGFCGRTDNVYNVVFIRTR